MKDETICCMDRLLQGGIQRDWKLLEEAFLAIMLLISLAHVYNRNFDTFMNVLNFFYHGRLSCCTVQIMLKNWHSISLSPNDILFVLVQIQ